jgi:hypothetical protein
MSTTMMLFFVPDQRNKFIYIRMQYPTPLEPESLLLESDKKLAPYTFSTF